MKTVTKFFVALVLLFAALAVKADYTQHWWDPSKNGMGVPIHQQGNVIVATWFMYEPSGQPSFLSFAGSLTRNSQGRDQFSGELYRTTSSGGPATYDPSRKQSVAVGSVTLVFNSTTSATMQYSFSGQTGTMNLVPYVFAQQAPVLKYTDKVYAIWTGAYPFVVTKTSVVRVVNKTRFTTGAFPLFNCWLASSQLTSGIILVSCQEAVGATRQLFYINPLNDELYDYSGNEPLGTVWRVVENNSDRPEWSAKARVTDGWYFTPFDRTWILMFQPDNGSPITVKEGNFATDEVIRVMVSYSN